MTKDELVRRFREVSGLTLDKAEEYFDSLCGIMAEELLKGGEVRLTGIGKIVTRERAARAGRNPRTGEAIAIPASRALSICTSKPFAQKLKA